MHALRLLRAAVFAVACVTASLAMHVLAGGSPVGPDVLVPAALPVTAGAFLLARRRRGFGMLLGAGFVTQYGLHLWFSAGAEPPPAQGHPHAGGLSAGLFMLLVHAATALLSAYWLERGESGLALLLRLLVASILTVLLWRLPVTARRTAVPARCERVPLVTRLLAATVSRRGPPVPFSVV
ncbi:hypothetical protein FHS43_002488 [Streptosporangium becharense]|uniref:MFS transporter n=1 Tax=Streptosporangium becharense TaxID=1816182 RepID=A0A7W9IJ54_9ACTN|nr:hypothetical protein [Streptosporangium becharense]MBB2911223.1 hypothetical protein [Streptosporangium becharense]MBB5821719.1 hypothetical protein [Streptosporangium becharense]